MGYTTKTTVKLLNSTGQVVADLRVKPSIMEAKANRQLIHDYVVQVQKGRRAWSASTKTRAEVRASGVKPWRQKGTGRARAGSLASPLFRGGGVVFGPKPKVLRTRVPKRMKRAVFDYALGEKVRQHKLMVVDDLRFDSPKTKIMAQTLRSLNLSGKVLLVTERTDRNVLLSVRNLPDVTYRSMGDVSAHDILRHEVLLLTKTTFDALQLGEPGQE